MSICIYILFYSFLLAIINVYECSVLLKYLLIWLLVKWAFVYFLLLYDFLLVDFLSSEVFVFCCRTNISVWLIPVWKINMASTACFMIVSRNDIPIYEAEVGAAVKVWFLHWFFFRCVNAIVSLIFSGF